MEAIALRCINCGSQEVVGNELGYLVCKSCGCDFLDITKLELVKEVDEEAEGASEKRLSEEEDLLRRSYYGYGKDQQLLKGVEELNELAVALMHYRNGKVSAVEVASEVADVEIMCAKMRIMLGKKLCKEAKKAKLKRLAVMFEEFKQDAAKTALPKDFKPVESDGVGE